MTFEISMLILCYYYYYIMRVKYLLFPMYCPRLQFILLLFYSFILFCIFFVFRLQARLSRYLKILYTELALKEPIVPQWAHPTAPGALCPARLEPDFRLHPQSHGFSDCLSVEQLLTPIQVTYIMEIRGMKYEPFKWANTIYCYIASFFFIVVVVCLFVNSRQRMVKFWKHRVVY